MDQNNHPITILLNTPIHCSHCQCQSGCKQSFEDPDVFLPSRPDLNKMIVWNGVEEDIMNEEKSKRPIRYCPGHDLSLDIIQYVAEQFLPFTLQDYENDRIENRINEQSR